MDDKHLGAVFITKTTQDYWDETAEHLNNLENGTLEDGLPEAEVDGAPRYYVHMKNDTQDGFSVYVDSDNKFITVEATLGPWQAKQVIDYIRNLPKEPVNVE